MIEIPILPSNWYDLTLDLTHGLSYACQWPLYTYAAVSIEGSTYNLMLCTATVFMLSA